VIYDVLKTTLLIWRTLSVADCRVVDGNRLGKFPFQYDTMWIVESGLFQTVTVQIIRIGLKTHRLQEPFMKMFFASMEGTALQIHRGQILA
jgi:hypothetical protein